ncbi:hypothetical protein EMIHUDRAFT_231118 [Emiliania huxleyi CCMP1516]|uniref:ABC transporter domain-containing protein n=2 Tax=Emiliania huxleyi TaxID=2903 RepID=A0A0D3K9A9_EMIH1|nr:hypothetical protein EMIHUDRAFT_231118 [Emiliania huxleyi CCMP1516]EOD32344.1 hypothetical protein EMIHUDRAFT_231118 [Emiliania huxleyi CCMP1516]|eukprot:XP_005784773.1 hypothetical protein EMIHUDRAFT_231118 [Emiliania huxleyi CCMP1516]
MLPVSVGVALAAASTLRWSSLAVEADGQPLLQPMHIEASPGRLLGILGPSGAGKSTLLGALAGRARPRLRVSGSRDAAVPPGGEVGVLDQSDAFFGLLTVRETLELTASLEGAEAEEVDLLLASLGIAPVQHSRVGDSLRRGISGGEKRRLSLGCALLAHPPLLIADEPTTGLDSHQAARAVRLLREAAASRGIPAVATLHQPRSSIWATTAAPSSSQARLVFLGEREAALGHFARLGYTRHPCPHHVNPAEFLIDLVSVDHDSPAAAAADEARIDALARAQNWRDRWVNGLRLCVSGGLALVFGEIFGRFGAAEYLLAKMATELPLDAAFAGGFGLLLHWRIGLRLPRTTLVGTAPHLVSPTRATTPCTLSLAAATCAALGLAIGALAPSADLALAAGIPVLGILNPAGTAETKPPSAAVSLASHASPIKRSLKEAPRMGGLALVRSGDEVLERLGLSGSSCRQCCGRLGRLLAAELALAYVGLRLQRPKYTSMAQARAEEERERGGVDGA